MDNESEPVTAVISVDGSDPVPMIATEHVEELASEPTPESEAVRIAEIEGETTVAVAAITADVETQRIEAENERVRICQENDAELAALRTSMRELELETERLRAELSVAQASPSNPTPQVEETAEAVAEAVAAAVEPETAEEQNLTQEFTPETTSSTQTEPLAVAVEESPVVVAAVVAPVRKRRRLI